MFWCEKPITSSGKACNDITGDIPVSDFVKKSQQKKRKRKFVEKVKKMKKKKSSEKRQHDENEMKNGI